MQKDKEKNMGEKLRQYGRLDLGGLTSCNRNCNKNDERKWKKVRNNRRKFLEFKKGSTLDWKGPLGSGC